MRKIQTGRSLLVMGMLAGVLTLGACSSGSDGAPGPAGPPGPPGPAAPGTPGAPVTAAAAVDTCVVCHGDAAVFSAREQHDAFVSRAASWEVVGPVVASSVEGINSAVITARIDDPGTFSNVLNVRAMWMNNGVRTSTNNAGTANVERDEDGNHVITITPSAAFVTAGWTPALDVTWRVRLNSGSTFPEAGVVAYQNARVMTPVRDQGCVNCHGDNIWVNAMGTYESRATTTAFGTERRPMESHGAHFAAYGVESCAMCHGNAAGAHQLNGFSRLMYYAHGIHQSNMVNQINNETGTLEVKAGWHYSVRYPGDNQNCSTCHIGPGDLEAVMSAPVSRAFCGSCHGERGARIVGADVVMDWDSFTFAQPTIEGLHVGLAPTVNCQSCHDGSVSARTVVGDFHVGFNPEMRAAENINMQITGVVAGGLNAPIQIQWRATRDDNSLYNACNTDPAVGPVFLGEFAARIAYMQGDDVANVGVGTFGQPGATRPINAETTTCAADGSATTTAALHAGAVATRAMVSFDGRPRVNIPGFANQPARVAVPSFGFMIADGAAAQRRQIVDSNKCLNCHRGNMYRHGGGRNDNVEACIACHNPSATDQGVREGLGIDASNSYDRKKAESFSLAYNMHAVHGVGERDAFYLVYRGRGLYGYGSHNTPLPRNWPVDVNGNPAAYSPGLQVFGSNPPANITHYLKKINFPNRLNNCTACHIEGAYGVPDQSLALAISEDSGVDGADQTDDTLKSPATAACTSCHQSGSPAVQAAIRGHAAQFSWTPQVIEGGKEAVLEAAQ